MTASPDIEETVLQVIREIVGKRRGKATLSDDLTKDLKIHTDDLSFYFVPELERRLGVKVPVKEWRLVNTGADAGALLRKYVRPLA